MSSNRRLAKGNASRPAGDRARSPAAEAAAPPPTLPRYKRPRYTMSDEARHRLSQLANGTMTARKYQDHLALSSRLLRDATHALNARLCDRSANLASVAEKRRAKSSQQRQSSEGVEKKSNEEEELERAVALLRREAPTLSETAEAELRDVIDRLHRLENNHEALRAAVAEVRGQPHFSATAEGEEDGGEQQERRQRQQHQRPRFEDIKDVGEVLAGLQEAEEEEEADDDDGGPASSRGQQQQQQQAPPGPIQLYGEGRRRRAEEYARVGVHEKYALNNDYVSFKGVWHAAIHTDADGVDLPDASRWFDEEGHPRLPDADGRYPTGGDVDDDEGDNGGGDDDDVVMGGRVLTYRCPITMQPLRDPFTSRKCRHTFEKEGVVNVFRNSGGAVEIPCPESACNEIVRMADFFVDEVFRRNMERARRRQEEQEMMADSDSDSADGTDGATANASLVETGTKNLGRVKTERSERR